MKRWLMLLACLMPNLSGCLAYAYPTVSHTPELVVPNGDGSVHAFRVDVDRTERPPQPTLTEYTLCRIPIEGGLIPSQVEVAHATGIYNPLGIGDFAEHERSQYSLSVRLYRPGYRTQEVQQWGKARDVQWSPASDLLAQECAIDDLLADPTSPAFPSYGNTNATATSAEIARMGQKVTWWELKDQKKPALGLQPGMESNSQKQALLFASSEYQRLAGSTAATQPANQAVRERLQQKAIWLRRYAEQSQ